MGDNEFQKELCGKVLFIISAILFCAGICFVIKYPFLQVDEWFTKALIDLPLIEGIRITIIDVHPPLYYEIPKAILTFLTALGIPFDEIIAMKLCSAIPYVIIMALAGTVIRKNYGWFTCGFFTLSTLLMCEFFTYFFVARMYSWGLLFILLSFLCVKPILEDNDIKYWLLLSLFTVLGSYTHYFVAFGLICLYIILFVSEVLLNGDDRRNYFKNWLISTVISVACYIPWLFKLFQQIDKVHNDYWVLPLTPESLLVGFNFLFIKNAPLFVGLVLLIICAVSFIWYYLKSEDKLVSRYALIGFLTVIMTIAIMAILSVTYKPIYQNRYVLPVIVLLWFSISIFISKLDFKKVIIPLLVIFLIVGAFNVYGEFDTMHKDYDEGIAAMDKLEGINHPGNIVVIEGMQKYMRFHDYLNETIIYTNFHVNNVTKTPVFTQILGLNNTIFSVPDDIENNKVYFICDQKTDYMLHPEDYKVSKKGKVLNSNIFQVKNK